MSTIIPCPSCSRSLRVPSGLSGQTVRCPTCGTTFVHTEPEAPPSSEREPLRDRDYDEEEIDELSSRRRGTEKPGKVMAIALMMLIGGIWATLHGVLFLAYAGLGGLLTFGFGWVCCLWPGPYYSLVMGILAIIKGSALLGERGHLQAPPTSIAVMQIVNIVNGDVPNCVMGIIALVFLNEPETRRYYRG
jgi:predicted Zn finger-like uncharacterized protein